MSQYDSIIVGAGHNGLVCAGYLARQGQRVLVLEAADRCGGLAADREFYPGYRASVAHTVSHFSTAVARELRLETFGFVQRMPAMETLGLGVDGRHIAISGNTVSGVDDEDAAAFRTFSDSMKAFADVLAPFWHRTMPRIGNNSLSELLTFARIGFGIRRIGRADMQELLRIISLPMRDLVDERFSDEGLKAALCWDGLVGSRLAPRSPNGAVLALLYRMSGQAAGAHRIPAGGVAGLVDALRLAAEAAGTEIRTGARVTRLLVGGDTEGPVVNGVQLASGETIQAARVVSSADPKRTFFDLVGVENLDIGFSNRIGRLRSGGYVGKLHLALDGAPRFRGVDAAGSRMIIAPSMDAIEFAFDDAKYGQCSQQPVMEIVVPSAHDASRAPDGGHVLSANVMYVPYALKGGWTDAARSEICERSIDTLEAYAPGLRRQILHSEFLTPADIESAYRVSGGHWHHVEFAFDQLLMMRPTYDAAQYRTPIRGLFLCGSGCHPGGGLMGAAGHNAAREILR